MDVEIDHVALSVGRTIAKHRLACGMTQEQVAELLNIGVEAVSRIERGVVLPTVIRLINFAHIFACNVADLLTESSPRSSDQAAYLDGLLSQLHETDRAMLISIVEQLVQRLK